MGKDAKAFVLLQEEGIAKGIRRITGVTSDDAVAAIKAGEEFEAKVAEAGNLKGLELEDAIKKLTVELNSLTISTVIKAKCRDTLATYGKTVVAWKKEAAAAKTKAVTDEVVAAAASTEGEKVVLR